MDHIIQGHGPVMGNRVNQRRLLITVKVFLGRRIHDQSERAVCRPAAAIRLSTAAPVPAATALCSPAGRTPAYAARTAEYVLLGLVTFSIYDIWQMSEVGDSLNLLAFKRDGKHTMHYCLMFFLVGWGHAGHRLAGVVSPRIRSHRRRTGRARSARHGHRLDILAVGHPRLAHRSGTVHL